MPFLSLSTSYLLDLRCTHSLTHSLTHSSNNPQRSEHCPRRNRNLGPSPSSLPHTHTSSAPLIAIVPAFACCRSHPPRKQGLCVRVCGRRALLDGRQKKTKTLYLLAHNVRIMVGLGQAGVLICSSFGILVEIWLGVVATCGIG